MMTRRLGNIPVPRAIPKRRSLVAIQLRRANLILIAVLAIGCAAPAAHAQSDADHVIVLNAKDTGRIFDGLGAVSAGASSRLLIDYPGPQRSQILDYLFKPGYGAALQHLKVEVGSDVNSTDGSEPSHMRSRTDHNYARGYEWWLMEEAQKRNPNIILDVLPWGAPGWIGDGHIYSTDMANYVADFIQGAERVHHLHIRYAGIWNERMYDSDYVKELASTFARDHIATKIVCCDSYPSIPYGQWSIIEAMQKDPELKSAVAAVGVHYPHERNEPPTPANARQSGKPLWSSEDQPNPGSGPFVSRDWPIGGRILAKQFISNYIDEGFTATEIWSPVTSYYDILAAPNSGLMYANTPWSGYYDVQGTIWATAHTTQFAQPGWQYLDSASGHIGDTLSYVSLKSPDAKNWSIILETIDASQPQTLTFGLEGGLSQTTVHVWQTDDTHIFEKVADVEVKDGRFSYTFSPHSLYSLTSTTGQGKGTATPPLAKAFPFPYRDDFENTPLFHSARFLADQDGAFEVRACRGRAGRCLQQVIEQKPIPWAPLPDPFTLGGDVNWQNYRLSADVQIPRFNSATLIGRIDSANVFKDRTTPYPAGYVLRVTADGHWQLLSTSYGSRTKTLAFGDLGDVSQGWHHMELDFQDTEITASLDAHVVASISDDSHAKGMVALGSDWGSVQFDNLAVSPR
jgi:O-glycosyl hydrolase